MSEWSKTPPTDDGAYWLYDPEFDVEDVVHYDSRRDSWLMERPDGVKTKTLIARGYEFGQRIPTNADLAAAAGERKRLADRVASLSDTLQRIAVSYPGAVQMCDCGDKPGYACDKCEIQFLLQEWAQSVESET